MSAIIAELRRQIELSKDAGNDKFPISHETLLKLLAVIEGKSQ